MKTTYWSQRTLGFQQLFRNQNKRVNHTTALRVNRTQIWKIDFLHLCLYNYTIKIQYVEFLVGFWPVRKFYVRVFYSTIYYSGWHSATRKFRFFVDFYFTSIYFPILTSFLRAKWQKWTIKRINTHTHTHTHTTTTKYIYIQTNIALQYLSRFPHAIKVLPASAFDILV